MNRIAIIAFFHPESSLCLSKYLAKNGCSVDYYYISNLLHDAKGVSGFEYPKAKRRLGNHLLSEEEVPEIYSYFQGLPVRVFLSRIIHHDRYPLLNKILMTLNMLQVKWRHYDAINIVGQTSWIMRAHKVLKGENLIHTFHELGNHQGELKPLPIISEAIKDRTKVILHSNVVYQRFMSIPGASEVRTRMIPFGKFETLKLYVKEKDVELPFKNNNPILLFYGYILPYKGLDVLAEAIKLLESEWNKFNVVIAGNGTDDTLPFFQNLPNGYVINRYLSNDEMMNLIRQSSVILLPYKSASQTGIIPTCALYGKPCIATKVGAFPESIKDGVNGILVEANDKYAFANAIEKVVNNERLRLSLSLGVSKFGEGDDYDWERIATKTEIFFVS